MLFANGPVPFPLDDAPGAIVAAWGISLSLAAVCFGLLVFKKLSDINIYLLLVAGLGFALLTCCIPNIDRGNAIRSIVQSRENLMTIAGGAHDHRDKDVRILPAAASLDADGKPLHGWQTAILPYIDQSALHQQIDMTLPWNDARNAEPMKQEVSIFLHPLVGERKRAEYALSHYAGNIHVIGAKPMKITQITDGASNTLLFGEVAHNYMPWGEPMNCRDPAAGLMVENGFATPRGDQVNFVFVDGSVRSISRGVSAEVLKALATPNGGESVNPDDSHR